ncbi:MAG: hypothetical protein HYX95_02510, partial [Chloroflexi bacterium]|nr:hypothetical protein [Chloroflexota bacterium]
MRVLCVLLPHFPWRCELQRRPVLEGGPALVAYSVGYQKLVLDHSPELDALESGMPLQEALSRHGEVEVLSADMAYYWSVFNRVLDGLEGKCPLVEGADLGCAYLGIDGLGWVYSGDGALVAAVREALPSPFAAQLGVAEGKFPAYLAALNSPPGGHRIVTGGMDAFLRDFPCDVLPIAWQQKKKLSEFGLRTLGQVAALPLGPLQAQFGPEGRRIGGLARGKDDSPLYPR